MCKTLVPCCKYLCFKFQCIEHFGSSYIRKIKNILTKPNVSLHAHAPAIHYMSCMLCNNNNVCIPYEGEGDHGPPQQQLNVPANFSRECLTINITNNNVTEENELFRISLGFFRPYDIYHVYPLSAIVTIIDDDCKSTFD